MLRTLVSVSMLALLGGCVSVSSSKNNEAPDYMAFCLDKEAQCKESCSNTGVQIFSCRASPHDGLEYKCECKRPLSKSI